MQKLTVVLQEQGEPPVETSWTYRKAAIAFAERRYAMAKVKSVKVFDGDNPETPGCDPGQLPGLILMKTKPY